MDEESESPSGAETGSDGGVKLDLRQLSIINQLGMVGINGMNEELSGVGEQGSADLHLRRTGFIDVTERHDELGDGNVVGIRAKLNETPGGHLLLMFDPTGAQYLAQLLMEEEHGRKGTADGGRITNKEAQRFVAQIGDVMLGGFVNGWENALKTDIGHSSPKIMYAPMNELVDRGANVDENISALIFDAQLRYSAPDSETASVDTSIYAFPDSEAFVHLINSIGK